MDILNRVFLEYPMQRRPAEIVGIWDKKSAEMSRDRSDASPMMMLEEDNTLNRMYSPAFVRWALVANSDEAMDFSIPQEPLCRPDALQSLSFPNEKYCSSAVQTNQSCKVSAILEFLNGTRSVSKANLNNQCRDHSHCASRNLRRKLEQVGGEISGSKSSGFT